MRRFRCWVLAVVVSLLAGSVSTLRAEVTVSLVDHFDDGILDPAWTVNFENASGWTYSESGTLLTVTDIAIIDLGQTFAPVEISQPFPAVGDFSVEWAFAWDSSGTNNAMQDIELRLSSNGQRVIWSTYRDHWTGTTGEQFSGIGANTYRSNAGTLPLSGSATVEISRIGETVTISWNNSVLQTGTEASAIDALSIIFEEVHPTATPINLSTDYVQATADICKDPYGDLDGNCRVDGIDFSILSGSWMVDCLADANDPACSAFGGPFPGGNGTQQDPYVIVTVEELQVMQDDLDGWYELGCDIDALETINWNGGSGFVPVGDSTASFTGHFDGQRHTISNLYINMPASEPIGLFGRITEGAEVTNVGLINADTTGYASVGTLVGVSNGSTVSQCWSSGSVTGIESGNINSRVGGLVAYNSGSASILKSFSSVNVTSSAWQVGGLTGYNGHGSVVIDCYATGDVTGIHKVGGLVGDNLYPEGGFVQRCYSTGFITGSGGGLIGFNFNGGVTYDSYWDTVTSGRATSVGGTGKTTTQMKQQATFVGWDFTGVWDINEGNGYPTLEMETIAAPACIGTMPNPISRWALDEETGTTATDSVGGHHGVVNGDAFWTDGIINGAISFDGDGDYIDLGDINEFEFGANDFSITAWFNKNDPVSSSKIIINKYDYGNNGRQWSLSIAGGEVSFYTNPDGIAGESVNYLVGNYLNRWVHVVCVREGSLKYLYIDGVLANTGPATDVVTGKSAKVMIGCRENVGALSRFFPGLIDEVAIYDRALTANEVGQMYQAGVVKVLGDVDGDLRVDGADAEQVARNWLVDCIADPSHPACGVHDGCGSALEIFDGVALAGQTYLATGSATSSCGTSDTADVWHTFTPVGSGDLHVSLCGSGFDTTLAVYDGCAGSELVCNDDSCGSASEVDLQVVGGLTYWLRVAGNNSQTGDYVITATLDPFIAGDVCTDATVVTEGAVYNGSTTSGQGSDLTSCAFGDNVDVWHSYTAVQTTTATVSLCGSSFDTTLAVFDSCGGAELVCNDDGCGLASELTLDVTTGTTYLIRVAGFNGSEGDYSLLITEQMPSNDDCGAALAVDAVSAYNGSTVGATGSDVSSCGAGDDKDVWHSYTATSDGLVSFNTCGSDFDTTLAVYDGCGGSELACNDNSCGNQSKVTLAVTNGTQYLIRVAGVNGAVGDYTLAVIE